MSVRIWCLAGVALASAAAAAELPADGDVVIENAKYRLVLGGNARAKSLRVKATGEEMLDLTEDIPVFSVIQDRPFNNEVKLTFPNKRTEFRADRVRRVGNDLLVGFELVSYEAQIRVTEKPDYVLFELVDFPLGPKGSNNLSMTDERSRILAFGGELLEYRGFTTESPYRFTGVTRGAKKTNVVDHPQGQIGGVLDVCEFGGWNCYIDQRTDLQDEIADKIAKIYNCGFEFMYNDGSEGVNVPQGIHVANAQYRVWKKLEPKPLFMEGAAKSHFGWHHQSGANAFDLCRPEQFKEMIARWPLYEAPLMRENFTQLDFGWWGLWEPRDEQGAEKWQKPTVGTQIDQLEYGTSKAAAWDCPATLQLHPNSVAAAARIALVVSLSWRDRDRPEELLAEKLSRYVRLDSGT